MRKKKPASEQHVRERKSNATKQFAYNKLKTERHQSMKSKPSRPPQPKVTNAEKEGMLIDLSPNENPLNSNRQLAMSQTPTNVSLLDAPIDVPTNNSSFDLADVRVDTRLVPPPYQYPPTYMNTLGLSQPDNPVNKPFPNYQQSHHSDPFDTSYFSDDANLTTNSNSSLNAVYNNIQTTNAYRYGSTVEKNVQISQRSDGKQNNSNGAIAKQKPMTLTSDLDTLVMNTMASLSPRNSVKNLSFTSGTDNKYSNNLQWNSSTHNVDIDSSNSESLSDSLRVNLSALSLDDSVNNSAATPKKLDKSLYSDLEKEIYKSEATSTTNVNVNTSQNYDRISLCKENSVSAIPSEIYERRSDATSAAFSLNKVQNSKPVKQTNTLTKSTNQEIAQVHRNPYEIPLNFTQNAISLTKNYSTSMHPYAKQNNTETTATSSSVNDTNSVINQIWFEQTAKDVNVHSPRKSFYSNATQPQSGPEKNHNFVAISNRPTSMIQNDTKPLNTNIYSSVAGDFYSSVAGDFYDTVPSSNAASALYVSMPRNNSNSIYGNESQTVPVIYDEVSNDELLRPHRPAPLAPPPLSSQQIQRRLEKERQNQLQQQQIYGNLAAGTATGLIESQKVLELMQEIGDDATHIEATQALQAVGWDHSLAVRHFKIERLMR